MAIKTSKGISPNLIAEIKSMDSGVIKVYSGTKPDNCNYCDDDGMVETDNNGPIGYCPFCHGTKRLKTKGEAS